VKPQVTSPSRKALLRVIEWYFLRIYGRVEGPGTIPYYCDPKRVGHFAVSPKDLASVDGPALFRLFVAMAMFQARRDVVIMSQQRSMSSQVASALTAPSRLKASIARNGCPKFFSAEEFDAGCDVGKQGKRVDCGCRPGVSCHVKDATVAFNRLGDMGKLPTSAWLHFWKVGGPRRILSEVFAQEPQPTKRARLLVEKFSRVHRVGRKLATMFVSALSTPALAPDCTPWFPEVDGNELVIVDTHVARAADVLRAANASKTYEARERWVQVQAARIDLQQFHPDVPSYSPRLVQQALYAFCSKSNREARGDACFRTDAPCASCLPVLCPFAAPGC
jgi:hypothetical protein